jgi:hypothetical protein
VLVVALSSPLLVGIYKDDKLIKTYESSQNVSDALPKIFKEILQEFECEEFFYANGPGSFMAIKVGFVYLRSMQIALNIPLYACDGFEFNQNSPIKALGNQWFFKEKEGIVLKQNSGEPIKPFTLPEVLERSRFGKSNTPLYILPAV